MAPEYNLRSVTISSMFAWNHAPSPSISTSRRLTPWCLTGRDSRPVLLLRLFDRCFRRASPLSGGIPYPLPSLYILTSPPAMAGAGDNHQSHHTIHTPVSPATFAMLRRRFRISYPLEKFAEIIAPPPIVVIDEQLVRESSVSPRPVHVIRSTTRHVRVCRGR